MPSLREAIEKLSAPETRMLAETLGGSRSDPEGLALGCLRVLSGGSSKQREQLLTCVCQLDSPRELVPQIGIEGTPRGRLA